MLSVRSVIDWSSRLLLAEGSLQWRGRLTIKQPTNDKQSLARHKEWKYLGEQLMTPRSPREATPEVLKPYRPDRLSDL